MLKTKKEHRKNHEAQSITEYILVIGAVVVVFSVMAPMMKRLYQGMILVAADQLGNQQNSDQSFNLERGGIIQNADTNTRMQQSHFIGESVGDSMYGYADQLTMGSNQIMNMGYTYWKDEPWTPN